MLNSEFNCITESGNKVQYQLISHDWYWNFARKAYKSTQCNTVKVKYLHVCATSKLLTLTLRFSSYDFLPLIKETVDGQERKNLSWIIKSLLQYTSITLMINWHGSSLIKKSEHTCVEACSNISQSPERITSAKSNLGPSETAIAAIIHRYESPALSN